MLRRIARFTLAVVLTFCLGLAFTPLGCGGSQGGAAVSHPHGGEGPTVPDATVSKLTACAEQGKRRLKEDMYALQFNVEVTESGHADRVKLKDSYPSDGAMESCIGGALEDMSVPAFVVQALLADADPPESSGNIGFIMVLGGAVALVPATVVAPGVTVLVSVTVYLSKEVIETARRRRPSEGGYSPSSPRVMPLGPCEKKCQDAYEDAAAVCGRMADAAQRSACQDSAYARYKSCREGCQKKQDDDCQEKYERCRNYAPWSCEKKNGGTTQCKRCQQRCEAGDSPSPQCKKCLF
jgi:hypothetical protein